MLRFGFRGLRHLVVFLSIMWVFAILTFEVVMFQVMPDACWLKVPSQSYHVLVVSDPQLTDWYSYGTAGFVLLITQFYSDVYMRRVFRRAHQPADAVVMLGDLFDGGSFADDEQFAESAARFDHIFRRRKPIPMYNTSGNHDIGYPRDVLQNPTVLRRFQRHFGSPQRRLRVKLRSETSVGETDLVLVNSQGLDVGGHMRHWEAWSFVKSVGTVTALGPRIVFSHTPLFRANWQSCGGVARSRSPLTTELEQWLDDHAKTSSVKYQNFLLPSTTKQLLNILKPQLVLSAHNHEHCYVWHNETNTAEVTLGTFSWLQGSSLPSFAILSVLSNSPNVRPRHGPKVVSGAGFQLRVCSLPPQVTILSWYGGMLGLSLIALYLQAYVTISAAYRKLDHRGPEERSGGVAVNLSSHLMTPAGGPGVRWVLWLFPPPRVPTPSLSTTGVKRWCLQATGWGAVHVAAVALPVYAGALAWGWWW